jgi:hypothetical protein
MRRCSVNSFDLSLAGALARRLREPENKGPQPVAADRPWAQVPPVAAEPAPAAPGPIVDLHAPPLELESWEVFLAWSLELCRARAGFVVDPQGFVVATRGNVPTDHFDGLGAELAYAMEQLDRIDAEAGSLLSIELQFASRRLLAMRVSRREDGSFVIGYVGSRPLGDDVRNVIARQVAHSLDRLT